MAYPLNGTESAEFSIEITFVGLVAKTSDNHGFVGVAANVRIFIRFD